MTKDIAEAYLGLLWPGDVIRCGDREDAVSASIALTKKGIPCDLIFEFEGKEGIWVEIA